MRLYDKLIVRTKNREPLDMRSMTYEELYQLWWKERCTDSMIAALYNVRKTKVTNLRNKWGIKVPETIVKEFDERFPEQIPPFESDLKRSVSEEAIALIQRINDLNDLELESLRLELSRHYQLFSQVTQEVDFLMAVEKVIQQFWK